MNRWLRLFHWTAWLLVFQGLAGAASESNPTYQSPGTRRMAERLEGIVRGTNPMDNRFLSLERAEMARERLARATSLVDRADFQQLLAVELLNGGASEAAAVEFEKFEKLLIQHRPDLLAKLKLPLKTYEAMCYLRLAEQDNCLTNHTTDSCLLPIKDGGVHRIQRGSRRAVGILTNLLAEFPADLAARWLLNIACMTLGEYPDKVPPPWLIPARVFESDYDIKRFYDVAGGLGLDVDDLAGGSILEDFDGDGNLDVMVSAMGLRSQLRFFHNNGDGTFSERTQAAGLTGEIGGLNLVHADYNNDGFPDVVVLRGGWMGVAGRYPFSLLRNNGNGTFDDVTEEAGVLHFRPTQTAVWFDYDNDGWLDLFVGNESTPNTANPCELFRNNRNGTFTECAAGAGLAVTRFVKGVTSADYNNDGRPDLYLSCRGQPNLLFRNDGPATVGSGAATQWKFTDVTAVAGVADPIQSFPTWFFDYDNDGWPDLFVAGYQTQDSGDIAAEYLGLPTAAERARLYHNNRDGTFSNRAREARLDKVLYAMGSNFGDLDNDGWLDFYIGTGDPELSTLIPNRMFRNAEGRYFQDVTTSGGFGHLQKGHGVSFGDIDNDGDQDVYETMGGAYSGDHYRNVLYENPGHGNHWITLKLEGTKSNRSAIGARIKITLLTSDGERVIHRTVGTGGSFGGSPLRQEIGLGKATAIKSIEVSWPASGQAQVFRDVSMDAMHRIREGEAKPSGVPLKTFKLAPGPVTHQHEHHH